MQWHLVTLTVLYNHFHHLFPKHFPFFCLCPCFLFLKPPSLSPGPIHFNKSVLSVSCPWRITWTTWPSPHSGYNTLRVTYTSLETQTTRLATQDPSRVPILHLSLWCLLPRVRHTDTQWHTPNVNYRKVHKRVRGKGKDSIFSLSALHLELIIFYISFSPHCFHLRLFYLK